MSKHSSTKIDDGLVEMLAERVARLERTNAALVKRVEHNMDAQGSAFALFQSNIVLDKKVKERTANLQRVEKELQRRNGQLQALNKELARERDVAEAADRAKSTFLANMSHELRTPMHGILSYAKFGLDKGGSAGREKINEYFTEIFQSASSLMSLLNALLDLSKLDADSMTYDRENTDLLAVVNSVEKELRELARERGLSIMLQEPDIPTNAYFDPRRLTQVVRNLISNAIKFSTEGTSIDLRLRESNDETGEFLHLQVENTGVGISADEQTAVFDKFIQSSKTRTGAGGTGLGLSISKSIVEGQGGRIWVVSEENGVTCFEFKLPRRGCDEK